MKTDSLFYRLFQNSPRLCLTLLQLDVDAAGYEFVSEEIKQTSFRIDGIFKPLSGSMPLNGLKPEDGSGQPLIFVEVQFQPDLEFYARFFSEIFLYLYRQKPVHPWLGLVIYPDRSVERLPGVNYAMLINAPQVKRIYLEDYLHKTEPGYDMLKLIACAADETVALARRIIEQPAEADRETLEFIETVVVYKLPKLSREEIRIMLGLNDVSLKQTRFYQEIAEEERQIGRQEGRQEGKQEGRQEGIQLGKQEGRQEGIQLGKQEGRQEGIQLGKQEGRQEGIQLGKQEGRQEGIQLGKQEGIQVGRIEGESQLLAKLLSKRFGPLPAWAREKMAHADIEQLELWGERVLDAETLADIFA
jgi:predicted transposase/invertase (TIGR01784 family)